jgi:hypothetical protein
MEQWWACWNVRIHEEKTLATYFPHRHTPVEAFLTLKGRQIPFANHVKYVTFVERTYKNDSR